MSKQRPDPEKVANELAGASSFFKRPAPPASEPEPVSQSPVVPAEPPGLERRPLPGTPEIQASPVRPVRDGRPARRIMIRHPFEIYADQLEGLRALSERVRRQGENGSMSKMVRDAIDRLLDEHDAA